MLIFLAASTLTVLQMKKYGIRGQGASLPTAIFMTVACIVFIATIIFLLTVDWNLVFDLGNLPSASPYIPL